MAIVVDENDVMAVSKNFLAVVGLAIFAIGLLALHPLAPHSGERTVEAVVEHDSTTHPHN